MVILLTGGTGFLGSNLLSRLCMIGEVVLLKRSNSNLSRIKDKMSLVTSYDIDTIPLEDIFINRPIDMIIHCATHYGRKCINPLEIIEANYILPLKLLHIGTKHEIKCFINTDTILDMRINFYTLSKKQFRQWLEMYSSSLLCVNMELEHFYGPLDDSSKFVTNIIHQLLQNKNHIALTKGDQKRSFIYIEDVVDAFISVIRSLKLQKNGFLNYQVATRDRISIKDIVKMIKKLTGNTTTELCFGEIPYRENEIMDPILDISPLENLGWKPQTLLINGLKKTIKVERHHLTL